MPDSLGDGSAQSSPDSNRLTCGVCSEEIPAYHLGAKVCRPCAAFYKRAVVEKLKYRCRTGLNNCYLSGDRAQRTKCRACRFAKCQSLGIQLNVEPTIVIEPHTLPWENEQHKPLINTCIQALDAMREQQFAYTQKQHPELKLKRNHVIVVRKVQIVQVEQESVRFMLAMCEQACPPYRELAKVQKHKIFMLAYTELQNLYRCLLTAQHFPDTDDTRMIFSCAYSGDPLHIDRDWWFEGYLPPENVVKYYELAVPALSRTIDLFNQFKRLKMNKVDVVVFMYLALYKHAEYSGLCTTALKQFKEDLMKEWVFALRLRWGAALTERLSNQMIFYKEADEVAIMTDNSRTQMRLLTATGSRLIDCDIEKFMKDLKLVD